MMPLATRIHQARELGRLDYEQEKPMRPPSEITHDGLTDYYLGGYRQAYRDAITAAKASIATRSMVERIAAGDLVPNTFGRLRKVTEVFGKGEVMVGPDKGKAYVCFNQEFGESSTMSNAITEGHPVASYIASLDPTDHGAPVA
jgi:hypothetical protein